MPENKSLLVETKKKIGKIPNGAADQRVDPRQALFLTYYLNPKSESFSNALQSALKAGYKREYAENITSLMPAWLSESIGDMAMLAKAERNLNEILDLDYLVPAMGAFGPIIEKVPTGKKERVLNKKTGKKEWVEKTDHRPVLVSNAKLLAIKQDTSKFVAERLGRKKYGNKPEDPFTPGSLVQNFTQINIHPPHGDKSTGHTSES